MALLWFSKCTASTTHITLDEEDCINCEISQKVKQIKLEIEQWVEPQVQTQFEEKVQAQVQEQVQRVIGELLCIGISHASMIDSPSFVGLDSITRTCWLLIVLNRFWYVLVFILVLDLIN